ncbi:MAG: hypothetical protein H7Z15_10260 [Rhizobacter sp.]|nr:hypothetical protein [Rhizobacter sp.]
MNLTITPWMPALTCCLATLGLSACGGGGDDNGTGGGGSATLQAEIDRLFPYVPNQPLDVLFQCARSNSRLTYYFGLSPDLSFVAFFETDTYQQVSFTGTYTHGNGAIRLVSNPNPVLLLDETTTRITPHLGLAADFETPLMRCGAVAHGYNDPATTGFKSYGCPLINLGPQSAEDNAFEFDDSTSPFGVAFRGGIFRQRDVDVYLAGGPTIWRGYGIYRRVGNTFYADFGSQFPDHKLLKGAFANADQQVSVEQLEPERGPCNRR